MDNEYRYLVTLAIQIVIFSTLLGVVILFSLVSYQAQVALDEDMQTTEYIGVLAELNQYNGRIVKGVDVIECLTTYARLYDFEVITELGTYTFNYETETKSGLGAKLWSYEYITQVVPSDFTKSNYKATLVYNESRDVILGVRFEKM